MSREGEGPSVSPDKAGQWTVSGILRAAGEYLGARGVESPRLEAELLLAHVLQLERLELFVRHEMPVSEDARAVLRGLVRRRAAGEPTAYILGEKEFYGIPITVDPRCLIPRPETEHLVDEALTWLRARSADFARRRRPATVVDVGTGSGCIAVALAQEFSAVKILAVELDAGALDVARGNVQRMALESRVSLLQGDLLEPAREEAPFDLIVSNPPYVTSAEMAEVPATVRDFEPRSALSPGDDGLVLHRRLVEEGLPLLAPGGMILVELPEGGDGPMQSWLTGRYSRVSEIRTAPDLAGIPRVLVVATRETS